MNRARKALWLLQAVRAISRKETAETMMEESTDGFQLNKGEKLLKAAQWDLERVYRRIYGDNVDRTLSNVSIIINTKWPGQSPVTLDAEGA
jgi:hypothetical protein